MAITLQDIHAVADIIAAEGGKPTLAVVRKALGGGSFTTISEGMQAWKVKHQAQTIVTPLREAAPAAVSERLSAFGGEIWAIALELSNARLQSEREALEQVRQELAQTQQETIDLADQLNEELELAQALIKQQAEALDKAGNEATAKSNELASEKSARLEAERKSEIAMAGLTETHQQISALNLHINELKAENKAFRTEANENYKKAVTAESELSKTLERLSDIKAELGRESERHKLNADKATTALAEKEESLKTLTNKLEIAIASEIESAQAIKTLQGKMDVMKEQNELSHAYLDAIKKIKIV
jgi:DNA repair exonuclease SbcCD ATPase subunit